MLLQSQSGGTPIFVSIILLVLAQVGLLAKSIWDQYLARNEQRRTARLARVGKQLSDLYGPLYALYETGERHWFAFLGKYSNDPVQSDDPATPSEFKKFFPEDRPFDPPNAEQLEQYRFWMRTIFNPTNTRIEEIIVSQAELIIGNTIPDCFLDFCVHVAGNKLVSSRWNANMFDTESVDDHKAGFHHPGSALSLYISASFSVLKEEQERLLNPREKDVNENVLNGLIKEKFDKLYADKAEREKQALRRAAEATLLPANAALNDVTKAKEPDQISDK